MSDRIICQGCGQRIELPADYRRNKIQCPECGVITPVNLAEQKGARAGAANNAVDTPFDTVGAPSAGNALAPLPSAPVLAPQPKVAARPEAPRPRPPEPPPPQPTKWICQNCGEWQLRQPHGKKPKCPVCKAPVPVAEKPRAKGKTEAVTKAAGPRTAVPQTDWSDNPEDSKPYRVDAAAQPACPGCGKLMEPEAIVCIHCGHDLRVGSRAKTTYDPIKRRWDAGLARSYRLFGYGLWQCFAIPPTIWGIAQEGHAFYAIGSWMWLSLMAAFLFGTYDRIDLERNPRGKIRLRKTWHLCFIPTPVQTVDLIGYESIMTGQVHELDFTDYLVLLAGIGFFLVPGIIWYFLIMRRDTYYVALTKDHGHPDLWLYRGWSEERAKEIATTLRTAALPEYAWY